MLLGRPPPPFPLFFINRLVAPPLSLFSSRIPSFRLFFWAAAVLASLRCNHHSPHLRKERPAKPAHPDGRWPLLAQQVGPGHEWDKKRQAASSVLPLRATPVPLWGHTPSPVPSSELRSHFVSPPTSRFSTHHPPLCSHPFSPPVLLCTPRRTDWGATGYCLRAVCARPRSRAVCVTSSAFNVRCAGGDRPLPLAA